MIIPVLPTDMRRILVLGSTGSGKSTLAKALAVSIGGKHIELDAQNFIAGWQNRPTYEFRQRIEQEARAEKWVIDGNYGSQRDVSWPRADTAIFLDYPLRVVLWRLTKRITKRAVTQEDLWGTGNRENFVQHLQWNKDSLYFWAITTHQRRRREIPLLMQTPEYAHLRFIHLTSPHQTDAWLKNVRTVYPTA